MADRERFQGKVALVTGAGSGIGRATALMLAEEAAAVAAVDLNPQTAAETASMIAETGGRSAPIMGDVSTDDGAASIVGSVLGTLGRLDVLVNSAGVSRIRPLADSGEDEVDLMIAVNLKGPLFMAKHAVQAMLRQGDGGAIVNIASATVTRARRDLPVYIATKGAVAALTRSLAIDFAGDGIRANCVSPSATETPMLREHYRTAPDGDAEYRRNIAGVPLQRLATPQEIAHAILFLASDESSYVTGQVLGVDGGSTAGILMH